MKDKAPAYQRYPKQILGDDKVLAMDWDTRGMHNWLLDIAWQQEPRGTIPNDHGVLRRWLGSPSDETWRRVWPQLSPSWPVLEGFPDKLCNHGMIRCAEKQANYSHGNTIPKGAAKQTQTDTQITRKNIEEEVLVPVLEVDFGLEAFDFEEAFNKLCEIYPRSDRSYIAQTNFIKAVESVSKRKKLRRSEAAAYILSRTEIYVSKCKFISGLTKYLDSEVYDQKEAMWESVVQGDGNGASKSEQRNKRNRENLEAGLRAFHGDSAMDVLGSTGTKHRDPVIGTDAVVASGPKILPPRSD